MGEDGKTPVVVQFMQHKVDRQDDDLFYIRADLLQVILGLLGILLTVVVV